MFECRKLEFQCLKGNGRNSNVNKNRARITMFQKYGQNSNVNKNRAGIPIFERIKQKLKTSIKIGPEFQCLKRPGRNTSAYKDDA